jgi:hypothetical protein
MCAPIKIVSGGQSGADRAGLDFAIAHGVSHGGWCPKDRKAEDGPIHNRYELQETRSSDYAQRTEWNVRDSDGTVVFSIDPLLTGGSKKTIELARKHGRPCLHLSAKTDGDKAPGSLKDFIQGHGIAILNVAGPRASKEPGVAEFVKTTLMKALVNNDAA